MKKTNFPVNIFVMLLIIISVSCKKENDGENEPISSAQRILEVLYTDNGTDNYKELFTYSNGLLSTQFAYQINDMGEWEYSHKIVFEYESNLFRQLTFSWMDDSWQASGKTEAVFSGENLIEVSWYPSVYPLPKLKRTIEYEEDLPVSSIHYELRDGQLEKMNKQEYLYNDGVLYRRNLYLYDSGAWNLKRYLALDYTNNLVDEIRDYRLVDNEWKVDNKYCYYYENQRIVKLDAYSTHFLTDTLSYDYTIEYRYNENENLEWSGYQRDGTVSDTYFTYEAGNGNHLQTLGAISRILNFPIDWPRPVKK